jgi:hypothetical protein
MRGQGHLPNLKIIPAEDFRIGLSKLRNPQFEIRIPLSLFTRICQGAVWSSSTRIHTSQESIVPRDPL